MSKNPCKRKCWGCGNVAMHADNITPDVCCSKCGSQDTRLIREKEPNVGPIYGVELIDTLPLGKASGMLQAMPTRDDLRSVRCERVAAGYEVLLAHYLELRNQQPAEPTYTMSQAIDRIIDGLRLEWKEDDVGGRVRRITSSNGIFASYRVVEFGDRFVAVIPSGNVVCGSIQHGQQLCLNVEKRRFRAELEKAVKS